MDILRSESWNGVLKDFYNTHFCGTVTVVLGLVGLSGLYLEVTDKGTRLSAATPRLFIAFWELWLLLHLSPSPGEFTQLFEPV